MQDRSTFFWPGLGLEEADELILSFISQFYGPHSAVPPRVVIPWLPGGGEDESPADQENSGGEGESALASLASALADLRGGPVYISAPRNADENRLVDMAKSNAREAARGRADMPLSERLKLVLHASRPIERIECVDVSHTGGQATKVGMVVYEEGRPRREDYRVWNIEGAGGDDYAALSMWAERRLEHGAPWPDLLLIDGGRGQLAAVYRVLCEGWSRGLAAEHEDSSLPFLAAGIAKARDERGHADRRAGNVADRIFVPGRSNPLNIREGSPELLFLQSVRDATHDFSIGRHRQARAKQAFSGELQRLPGVGPATAKTALGTFFFHSGYESRCGRRYRPPSRDRKKTRRQNMGFPARIVMRIPDETVSAAVWSPGLHGAAETPLCATEQGKPRYPEPHSWATLLPKEPG